MKFDWQHWGLGGKIIFVAACFAVLSMFMNWVDLGIVSANGLSQGAFLFLALWVYPVLMLFNNEAIKQSWGLGCAVASVVLTLVYISNKSFEFFGETGNAAAGGAILFLLASIALIVGVIKYQPTPTEEAPLQKDPGV